MNEEMIHKAERFAKKYVWETEFSRQSFIDTLVIQDQTIQALKERWQENADLENINNMDSDENYRKVVDTINAHYMAILTDLLDAASPLPRDVK